MTDKKKLFDLSGKVALVTGASRGIGESIAQLLAAYGAHVIVSSRKQESCEKVVQAIKDAGGSASALACHVGEMSQIESAFETIKNEHGKLDILVNNAGILAPAPRKLSPTTTLIWFFKQISFPTSSSRIF